VGERITTGQNLLLWSMVIPFVTGSVPSVLRNGRCCFFGGIPAIATDTLKISPEASVTAIGGNQVIRQTEPD
jgi:hypothetical protein